MSIEDVFPDIPPARKITDGPSTDELLVLLKARQEDAWKLLYARYMSTLVAYGIKQRLLREDAEEVAHDSLIQVATHIDAYNEIGQTDHQWIWTIHRRKVIDRLRSKKNIEIPVHRDTQLLVDHRASPEEHMINSDQRKIIARAWNLLPEWAQTELRPPRGPGRKKKAWYEATQLFRALLEQEERP